jgi:hypothetical protein
MEHRRATRGELIHAVDHECVEMDVEVECEAEALDDGHTARLEGAAYAVCSGAPPKPARDDPDEGTQHDAGERGVEGQPDRASSRRPNRWFQPPRDPTRPPPPERLSSISPGAERAPSLALPCDPTGNRTILASMICHPLGDDLPSHGNSSKTKQFPDAQLQVAFGYDRTASAELSREAARMVFRRDVPARGFVSAAKTS